MKPYDTFVNHPCNNVCKKCRVKSCVRSLEMKKCDSCLVTCNSSVCYLDHLKMFAIKSKSVKKVAHSTLLNTIVDTLGVNFAK